MALKSLISKLFTKEEIIEQGFQTMYDGVVNFYIDKNIFDNIEKNAQDNIRSRQYIILKMLEEQDLATSMPNGFEMKSEDVVRLEKHTQEDLNLPPVWQGKIKIDSKSNTHKNDFKIILKVKNKDSSSDFTSMYKVDLKNNGPYMELGGVTYVLSQEQFNVFKAMEEHTKNKKSEYNNLEFVSKLQSAKENGCNIDLKHFNNSKLKILTPQNITVSADIQANGDLSLSPSMGQNSSVDEVNARLGQLNESISLRVKNEIILLSEEKIKAINEIISNKTIKKKDVPQFLKSPSSFLDAYLVNLDVGFSLRVHGITEFKHAYFGETDKSGIDWVNAENMPRILSITQSINNIDDESSLRELKEIIEDAKKTGASIVDYNNISYDISNEEEITQAFTEIENKINNPDFIDDTKSEKEEIITKVVDVDLNDTEVTSTELQLANKIDDVLFSKDLQWDNYKRTPFPHQEVGIKWIMGLFNNKQVSGSLLADDMGLGKTYMALSAIEQLYNHNESINKKPVLIVAPLSLLDNWEEEVHKTFKKNPFKDIIILQSNGRLKDFKNNSRETHRNDIVTNENIKYSLNIGKEYGNNRLDIPKRLVITTYDTLRDYQFSLCSMDWSMVIFDEAQNIKNPNALKTRAGKGLKADFKLLVTGTPVENSLRDFWCLMDTIQPTFLGSYQDFRSTYMNPIITASKDTTNLDTLSKIRLQVGRNLRLKVGSMMLRRLKEDNLKQLPKKTIYIGGDFPDDTHDSNNKVNKELESVMQGAQLQVYDQVRKSNEISDDVNILTIIQQLRNVSLHPQLKENKTIHTNKNSNLIQTFNESEKLKSILTILKKIEQKQEKCIIFVINKNLQAFLSLALGNIFNLGSLKIINGDTKAVSKNKSAKTRKNIIQEFEEKDGFNIIIMSPIAVGVGVTVVGANHVIHLERHWNPAKEAQATDRVYRIGQTKDVSVYLPLLHHNTEIPSFDINLHKLLTKKSQLKDAIITPEDITPELRKMYK